MNNTTNKLTTLIEQATELIQKNSERAIGNLPLHQVLDLIKEIQSIRDKEATYIEGRACKACIKKKLKQA